MYVYRQLERKINKYLSKPEIVAVIGPRQSGKTTLLKQIFSPLKPRAVYIDFEDRETLDLFNNDIKSFYELHVRGKKYLFIDEFQYAKEGGKKLKYLYDHYRIKIIISGSSALDLTHQAVRYLVGRIFVFHLMPFSFNEYLRYRDKNLCENIYLPLKRKINAFIYGTRKTPPPVGVVIIKKLVKHYHEYAVFGGYPRVVLAKDSDEKIMILKNIYNTYFLREIRDILQLDAEDKLQKLIKALALQTGSLVVYNELGNVTSLNHNSLLKHINILEKTFVTCRCLPFCKNKRTEVAKSPKIYFIDNGLRSMAVDNFQVMQNRVDRGALNENFVAAELVKREIEPHFWRTKSGAEIDFIFQQTGWLYAVEVKSTISSNRAGKAVLSFMDKHKPFRTLILSGNYYHFDKNRKILFMPLYFF